VRQDHEDVRPGLDRHGAEARRSTSASTGIGGGGGGGGGAFSCTSRRSRGSTIRRRKAGFRRRGET